MEQFCLGSTWRFVFFFFFLYYPLLISLFSVLKKILWFTNLISPKAFNLLFFHYRIKTFENKIDAWKFTHDWPYVSTEVQRLGRNYEAELDLQKNEITKNPILNPEKEKKHDLNQLELLVKDIPLAMLYSLLNKNFHKHIILCSVEALFLCRALTFEIDYFKLLNTNSISQWQCF